MRKTSGFTLIELLVVISIISMLSSIVISSVVSSRIKSKLASAISFGAGLYQGLGSDSVLRVDFDEGSGLIAKDSSLKGAGNNGTMTPTGLWSSDTYAKPASKYSALINNTGFIFGDRVTFSHNLFNKPTNAVFKNNFTVTHWIKTTVTDIEYTFGLGDFLFSSINGSSLDGFRFGIDSGHIAFSIGDASGLSTTGSCSSGVFNDGNWHNITGVFDRNSASPMFYGYLDGVLSCSVPIAAYPDIPDSIPSIPPSFSGFVGSVDDLLVFDQNMSGVSVRNLYESKKGKYLALK